MAVAIAVTGLALLTTAPHSVAATGDGYATWTLASGTPGRFTGTATLATGFPAVSFTSNSAGGSSTGIVSGASVFIPSTKPFGSTFGSSKDKAYLNLRPAANNATQPSTTTFPFSSPTPVGGWGFALGDIDAQALVVTGTDAAGRPVSGADLGLQATSN